MCAAALGLVLTASVLQAAESYEVTTERGVTVKMRDGVILRADIYRPKADGQFPVLLQRTPYNKSGGAAFGLKAAARGYVVIIQDVRGRYTSDGEWYTFKHEPDDGYDTVEWAAALPYLKRQGRHVGRLVCGRHADAGGHRSSAAPGGHLPRGYRQQLSRELDLPGRRIRAMVQPIVDVGAGPRHTQSHCSQQYQRSWRNVETATGQLSPVQFFRYVAAPVSTASLAPYFLDWLAHPSYDEYWKQLID